VIFGAGFHTFSRAYPPRGFSGGQNREGQSHTCSELISLIRIADWPKRHNPGSALPLNSPLGSVPPTDTRLSIDQASLTCSCYLPTHVNNNPINFNDPSGHWVETAFDIAFIVYDIYDIKTNGLSWISGLSLAADIAGAIIPIATGLGAGVRLAFKAGNAVDNVTDIAKAANSIDNIIDAGKSVDNLDVAKKLPIENHHFATNKNKFFTPKFDDVLEKYGLDLNGSWNIDSMPHRGRHPNEYHDWVLDEIQNIDKSLGGCGNGCSGDFIRAFSDQVIAPVKKNPIMVRKSYWIK